MIVDGLRTMTEHECMERLGALRPQIGRVGFVDGRHAVVLPVNYRLLHGWVVFRTTSGSKLHRARTRQPMSFEVDAVDASWQEGWSVLVRGEARLLDGEDLRRAESLGLRPWAAGERERYVAIVPETVTGRQIV
jgi:uncharacterized protein